jgi:hypothetical protein
VLTLKKRRGEEPNRREEKKIEARKRESVLGFGEGGGREREENVHTVRGVKVVAAYRDDAAVADHPAHHPLGALAAVATQF